MTILQNEFKALIESLGWNQAQAARELGYKHRAGVNQIVNGVNEPSDQVMVHLRKIAAERRGEGAVGALPARPPGLETAINDLTVIAEADPDKLREVTKIIATYRRMVKGKPRIQGVSSKVEAALLHNAESDVDAALGRSPKSSPKREAGGPSARKPAPSGGVPKRSK